MVIVYIQHNWFYWHTKKTNENSSFENDSNSGVQKQVFDEDVCLHKA